MWFYHQSTNSVLRGEEEEVWGDFSLALMTSTDTVCVRAYECENVWVPRLERFGSFCKMHCGKLPTSPYLIRFSLHLLMFVCSCLCVCFFLLASVRVCGRVCSCLTSAFHSHSSQCSLAPQTSWLLWCLSLRLRLSTTMSFSGSKHGRHKATLWNGFNFAERMYFSYNCRQLLCNPSHQTSALLLLSYSLMQLKHRLILKVCTF